MKADPPTNDSSPEGPTPQQPPNKPSRISVDTSSSDATAPNPNVGNRVMAGVTPAHKTKKTEDKPWG